MDLDKIRDQLKQVRAPGSGNAGHRVASIDTLVAALKVEDARVSRMLRRSMVFFAIAGLFYVCIFVLTWIAPPDDSPNLHRAILGTFAFVFLSLGIFSRVKHRELSAVTYAEPARAFLADAEKRYRFVRVRELALIVLYLVILSITCTVSLMTAGERYLPSLDPAAVLLFSCVFFPLLWAAAFALGWREWKRRKEPLLEEIRALQADLVGDEASTG